MSEASHWIVWRMSSTLCLCVNQMRVVVSLRNALHIGSKSSPSCPPRHLIHTSHNTLLHVQFAYMSSLLPDAYCVSLMLMHIEGQDGDAVCKPCCQSGYLNVLNWVVRCDRPASPDENCQSCC